MPKLDLDFVEAAFMYELREPLGFIKAASENLINGVVGELVV